MLDTICDNTQTDILLSSPSTPTNAVLFKYTAVADNPAEVSGYAAGEVRDLPDMYRIQETLDNLGDEAQRVVYTITAYTVDGSGIEKACPGVSVQSEVWVEPTPIVLATPVLDTICDNTQTDILLSSPSTPTNAVLFKYTAVADNPAEVSGYAAGEVRDLPDMYRIQETLDNLGDEAQRVVYTITAYTVDGSGIEKACPGVSVQSEVWVEPTPIVIATPVLDTICDNTQTDILLSSPSTPTNAVLFKYTAVADNPAEVSGYAAGEVRDLPDMYRIQETLDNLGDEAQRVVYTITAYTVDGSGIEKACPGVSVQSEVWVEPTPIVIATPVLDTICDNTQTDILLSSPSTPTNAVLFKYTAVADNPAEVSGYAAGEVRDLPDSYSIQETLDNLGDEAQRVVYTITAYTVDGSGVEKACPGVSVQSEVWVEPTPIVIATPVLDTICDNTQTDILLTSPSTPTQPVLFKYTAVADNPAEVSGYAAGEVRDFPDNYRIQETLDNLGDDAQRVVYTITAYTVDGSGVEKACPGVSVQSEVWVEPTPIVIATPVLDTICDNTQTDILLTSPSTPTKPVLFKYTAVADNPAEVSGYAAGEVRDLPDMYRIQETLDNLGDDAQRVVYTITAYTVDGSGVEKACPGVSVQSEVWVEPTPIVIATPVLDTICDNTQTDIFLSSPSTPTQPVLFKYTAVADNPAEVSGYAAGEVRDLPDNYRIQETLDNLGDDAQRVVYTITAYTVDGSGVEKACPGVSVQSEVWVEPTPIVIATPVLDTICDNTQTDIFLTSPSTPTQPVLFKYTAVADNPAEVSGYAAGEVRDLPDNYRIQETLDNLGDDAQRVVYTITAYTVDGSGVEKACPGVSVQSEVWVEPTPIVIATPVLDTICDNTQTDILLTSPSTPTQPVLFKYTAVADNPAEVSGYAAGEVRDLPDNYRIQETLDNLGDDAQRVVYTITAYTVDGSGVEKACPGVSVQSEVWVEPTPIVIATPVLDTICDNTQTDILLSSPSTPTKPVLFKYTAVADNPAEVSGYAAGEVRDLPDIYRIQETLDNLGDDAQRVVYTITAYTVDGSGIEKACPGVSVQSEVWVEPTPIVIATPVLDTICDNTQTDIFLSSPSTPTQPVLFKYTAVADNPAEVSGYAAGEVRDFPDIYRIQETLDNLGDDAQRVVYTITAYTVDGSGVEKACPGVSVQSEVWVEPTPIVIATPVLDTICDNTQTDIFLSSPSTPTQAVLFKYTAVADNPAEVSGYAAGEVRDFPDIYRIQETLDNLGDEAQRVVYTITAYTVDGSGVEKACPGVSVQSEVWVEPTPIVIATPVLDTICDNTQTDILLSSPSTPTHAVLFKYTAVADNPAEVSGYAAGEVRDLPDKYRIQETLDNLGDEAQRVVYTITAYTVDGSGVEKACPGVSVQSEVWVEPTPIVIATPVLDTICDNTQTDILLSSPSTPTKPVLFKYTAVADNPAEVSGYAAGEVRDFPDMYRIQETLDNLGDEAQRVVYTITAYTVDGSGVEKACPGVSVQSEVWVEPTPIVIATPVLDTICDNTQTDILLSSPSTPTKPVLFKYTAVADNPAEVSGYAAGEVRDLTRQVQNPGDLG